MTCTGSPYPFLAQAAKTLDQKTVKHNIDESPNTLYIHWEWERANTKL